MEEKEEEMGEKEWGRGEENKFTLYANDLYVQMSQLSWWVRLPVYRLWRREIAEEWHL